MIHSLLSVWHLVLCFTAYACYIVFAYGNFSDGPIPKSPSAIKEFLDGMPGGYGRSYGDGCILNSALGYVVAFILWNRRAQIFYYRQLIWD